LGFSVINPTAAPCGTSALSTLTVRLAGVDADAIPLVGFTVNHGLLYAEVAVAENGTVPDTESVTALPGFVMLMGFGVALNLGSIPYSADTGIDSDPPTVMLPVLLPAFNPISAILAVKVAVIPASICTLEGLTVSHVWSAPGLTDIAELLRFVSCKETFAVPVPRGISSCKGLGVATSWPPSLGVTSTVTGISMLVAFEERSFTSPV
jgi:hypothetical protein